MDHSNSDEFANVTCTLTTKDRSARVLEWTDLANLATSSTVIANGIVSTFEVELAPTLKDLVERERDCCGTWLAIELIRLDDAMELRLTTASADGVAMIRSMAGLST